MLPLPFRTLLTTPQEAEDVVGRSEVAEDFVEAAVVDLGAVSEEDSEEVVEAAMRDLTAEEAALEAVGWGEAEVVVVSEVNKTEMTVLEATTFCSNAATTSTSF